MEQASTAAASAAQLPRQLKAVQPSVSLPHVQACDAVFASVGQLAPLPESAFSPLAGPFSSSTCSSLPLSSAQLNNSADVLLRDNKDMGGQNHRGGIPSMWQQGAYPAAASVSALTPAALPLEVVPSPFTPNYTPSVWSTMSPYVQNSAAMAQNIAPSVQSTAPSHQSFTPFAVPTPSGQSITSPDQSITPFAAPAQSERLLQAFFSVPRPTFASHLNPFVQAKNTSHLNPFVQAENTCTFIPPAATPACIIHSQFPRSCNMTPASTSAHSSLPQLTCSDMSDMTQSDAAHVTQRWGRLCGPLYSSMAGSSLACTSSRLTWSRQSLSRLSLASTPSTVTTHISTSCSSNVALFDLEPIPASPPTISTHDRHMGGATSATHHRVNSGELLAAIPPVQATTLSGVVVDLELRGRVGSGAHGTAHVVKVSPCGQCNSFGARSIGRTPCGTAHGSAPYLPRCAVVKYARLSGRTARYSCAQASSPANLSNGGLAHEMDESVECLQREALALKLAGANSGHSNILSLIGDVQPMTSPLHGSPPGEPGTPALLLEFAPYGSLLDVLKWEPAHRRRLGKLVSVRLGAQHTCECQQDGTTRQQQATADSHLSLPETTVASTTVPWQATATAQGGNPTGALCCCCGNPIWLHSCPCCAARYRLLLCLLQDTARGLHHLHTLPTPLVHHDIKPANILVGAGGLGKLADFGLAACCPPAPAQSPLPPLRSNQCGTVPYAAPEVLSTPHGVTPSSDIYSLGCVLWEALRGERPWSELKDSNPDRENLMVLYHVLDGGGLSVEQGWPVLLQKLLHKCLARDPAERPMAQEVVDRLGEEIQRVNRKVGSV